MTTIISELRGIDPFDVLHDNSFYLKLVKQQGFRTDRLSVKQVLKRTNEQKALCERLDALALEAYSEDLEGSNAHIKKMNALIEEAVQLHPLSLPVLAAAASAADEPELELLLGLAMRQVANRPTQKAREQAPLLDMFQLHMAGIDFIVDGIADMEQYTWFAPLLTDALEESTWTFSHMARQMLLATLGVEQEDAMQAFQLVLDLAQMAPDDELQLEVHIIVAAHVFALIGTAPAFHQVASHIAITTEEEAGLAQDLVDEISEFIIDFSDAIAPYLSKTDTAMQAPRPSAPPTAPPTAPPPASPEKPRRDLGLSTTGNIMRDIYRHAERQAFTSPQEYVAFMQSFTGKVVPPIPYEDLTPEELMEDLVDEAIQLDEPEAMDALRGLTSAYTESALPWLALAHISHEADEKILFAEEGLKRCGKFEDADYVKENEGEYWGLFETRVYMRLLLFRFMGFLPYERIEDAIATGEQMLRLNTRDNLGVRFLLLPLYLRSDAPDAMMRADDLVTRFNDHEAGERPEAFYPWARTLYYYLKGRSARAKAVAWCIRAITDFPYVANTISNATGQHMKHGVSPRTTDEWLNLEVMNFHTLPAWRRHPDAVTWMRLIAEDMLGGGTVH